MTLTRRAFVKLLGLVALLPAWMVGKREPEPTLLGRIMSRERVTSAEIGEAVELLKSMGTPPFIDTDGKQYYVGVVKQPVLFTGSEPVIFDDENYGAVKVKT